MRLNSAVLSAAALLLAGCGEARGPNEEAPPPPVVRAEILKDVPVFMPSVAGDTTGTDEVERRLYVTIATADSVERFYQARLAESGWRIVGSSRDREVRNLHATDDSGRLLWVRITPVPPNAHSIELIARQGTATAPVTTDTAQ